MPAQAALSVPEISHRIENYATAATGALRVRYALAAVVIPRATEI